MPHPTYPRNTTIVETAPEFVWTSVAGAESYEVTIGFYDTYERICRMSSEQTSIGYPEDAEPLQPGRKYYWCVRQADDRGDLSEVVWFTVIDDLQLHRYSAADQALDSLYEPGTAAWYEAAGYLAADFGLYALGRENLRAALDAGNDTPALRRSIAHLLDTMEFTLSAKEMYDGLPELTGVELSSWRGIDPAQVEGETEAR